MTEYNVGDDYEPDPMAARQQFYVPAQRDTMKMLMLNAILAGALFNLMIFSVGVVEASKATELLAAASEGFAYLTAAVQVSAPRTPAVVPLLAVTILCGLAAFGWAIHG